MRHRTTLCLSCRRAPMLANQPRIKTERRWSSTAPADIYNLPSVVVDLDAIDSKIVQKLEDIPEKEQSRKWRVKGPSIVVQRKFDHSSTAKRGLKQEQSSTTPLAKERWLKLRPRTQRWPIAVQKGQKYAREFKHSRFTSLIATITAPDLLSYALLGEPPASFTQNNTSQRKQLNSYGLSTVKSTESKLEQLAIQFPTDPGRYVRQAGFTRNSRATIEQYIRCGSSFWELHRLVAMLSSTVNGCQFLVGIGDAVVYGIRRHRHLRPLSFVNNKRHISQSPVTISMTLDLLNNLVRNISLKRLKPGSDLCHAGLYYASKSGNIGAARMYLEISSANSYDADWMAAHAMRNLQVICTKGLYLPNPWLPWKDSNALQAEVLKFITTWRGEDPPRSSTPRRIRHPAFSMPLSVKSNTHHSYLYIAYLFGLGTMRLNTALRMEWEALNTDPLTTDYLLHAQIFAIAFILARDPKRALELLESVPPKSITGDLGAKKPLPVTTVQTVILNHYSLFGLNASKFLREQVEQNLRGLHQMATSEATHALELLEKFIILDFPKNIPRGEFEVDWVSAGGKEGLIVKFPGQMALEYFKPAGQGLYPENV